MGPPRYFTSHKRGVGGLLQTEKPEQVTTGIGVGSSPPIVTSATLLAQKKGVGYPIEAPTTQSVWKN